LKDEFMRIEIQGFLGGSVDSEVFELKEDLDLPINPANLKKQVCRMVSMAIDQNAEDITIYLTSMRRLKPK